jgi:hypothetical protein
MKSEGEEAKGRGAQKGARGAKRKCGLIVVGQVSDLISSAMS